MGKWWSVLFGVMMALGALLFIVAPFMPGEGWWLPQGVSTHASHIDNLFYVILGITGFFFILTEALMVYFMWEYAGGPGRSPHVFGHHAMQEKGAFWTSAFKSAFRPVSALLHDQHRIELAWTLVPAVILLYIAFAQINTWMDVKYQSRMPGIDKDHMPVQVEISARQFEWRMRYPSPSRWKDWRTGSKKAIDDARSFAGKEQADDIHLVNELHVYTSKDAKDKESKDVPATVVYLKTIDVLHSFNIPQMRVKQDSLPGRTIPVWFRPTKTNTKKVGADSWVDGYNPDTKEVKDESQIWEIACAELCGWGHYRMIGRVYVHESEEDFLAWLESAAAKVHSTQREGEKTSTAGH